MGALHSTSIGQSAYCKPGGKKSIKKVNQTIEGGKTKTDLEKEGIRHVAFRIAPSEERYRKAGPQSLPKKSDDPKVVKGKKRKIASRILQRE